jgi:hypothetical protein
MSFFIPIKFSTSKFSHNMFFNNNKYINTTNYKSIYNS